MIGYLLVWVRALVGVVLLVSAGSKVRSRTAYAEFGAWAGRLTLVPARLTRAVVLLTVAAEAVTVLLLAIPVTAGAGLALAAVVLSAFAASIGVIIRRGVSAPCRCFGASSRPVGPAHLTRNLALAALAAAAVVAAHRGTGPSPGPPESWLALLSGAAVAAVIIRLDDILPQ